MNALDHLMDATTPANPGAPARRTCRRHDWHERGFPPMPVIEVAPGEFWSLDRFDPTPLHGDPRIVMGPDTRDVACLRCGRPKDDAAARRGKASLRAGKDAERAIAKAYGGQRTGQYGGPDDVVVGDLFIIQSKAGRTWFRQAYVDELDKLPRAGGRVPTLVVSSRPGPGHPTRRYVVRLIEDDVALHGERP